MIISDFKFALVTLNEIYVNSEQKSVFQNGSDA